MLPNSGVTAQRINEGLPHQSNQCTGRQHSIAALDYKDKDQAAGLEFAETFIQYIQTIF
jgi:hypothetical protein